MKRKHNHPLFIIRQMIMMMKQMILPILAIIFTNLNRRDGEVMVFSIGALLLIFLILAFFSWKNTFYFIEDNILFYQKGVLRKSKQGISIDKITTINENQELIERVLQLYTFKVDAGSVTKGNEIQLVISKKEVERLKEELENRLNSGSKMAASEKLDESFVDHQPIEVYRISIKELILYAITSNGIFGGLVFALAVWKLIDDIPFVKNFIEGPAGSWLSRHLDFTVSELSIPDILSSVLLILLLYVIFSFLVSSVLAIVKYYDFRVSRQGGNIEITHGLLEKKRYHLSAEKITALYFKHGFIGQFCKMGQLKIESIGYGDEEGEAAILYPVIKDDKRVEMIKTLLPEYTFEDAVCKPPKRALKSFLIKYTSIPFILAVIASVTIPYGAFSWIAVALFCMAGFASYKKTKISRTGDQFVIMGGILGKWTTVIKSTHIQAINARQSFFQKRRGLIHLEYSYQSNDFGKEIGVQFMDQKEVASMMNF